MRPLVGAIFAAGTDPTVFLSEGAVEGHQSSGAVATEIPAAKPLNVPSQPELVDVFVTDDESAITERVPSGPENANKGEHTRCSARACASLLICVCRGEPFDTIARWHNWSAIFVVSSCCFQFFATSKAGDCVSKTKAGKRSECETLRMSSCTQVLSLTQTF